MLNGNPIAALRAVGLVEGVSFLVLLGIAMPLKYFAGRPEAVKVVGWIHGVLFVVFCGALLRATVAAKWKPGRGGLVFLASLMPFGPFLIDARMREYASEFASSVNRPA